ncbi:MAG: hypothetical protein M1839_008314 [Geoglossum umbratile]|nr:MAG: hypothetical protein M1839_008314 [Geoglossum umbratile]
MARHRDSVLGLKNSKPKPVRSNAKFNSRMTSLPAELRLQILAGLDLDQLSALVRASSVFYRDYRRSRRSTLTKCLQLTLRDVTIDACAVLRSSLHEGPEGWIPEDVTQFLHSYQDQRASAHNLHFTKHLTEDRAIRMAAFHSSIVKPLACRYVHWALTNLSKETKSSLDNGLLSKTEETRVLRALYRFQLCCNLFGEGPFKFARGPFRIRYPFPVLDILKLFLCLFEPWEVEEMVCIHAFAKEKVDQTFKDIRWDLYEENPEFEGGRPPTPRGGFRFGNSHTRDSLLEATISRGLNVLHMFFSGVSDHARHILVMQSQTTPSLLGFLENGAWSEITQCELRRRPLLSDREQKQSRREPLPFTGDGDSETDGPCPPLAWTVLWGGSYSNLFGEFVNHLTHRWGYVMWDAAQLEQTGTKELLVQQRRRGWTGLDPRDYFV